MPLSTGDKLGPYEILSLVGKGGMGEVYRAHDSRLNRDVAIKVSNAQFTERFTREARTIAALNHTNICHLYDVGPNYLVMEYVEGNDLRGPLELSDAIPIIRQLIDGIEAAHEKNIVHRDLEPANIKITPEGVVKILDFGLAKAMEPPPSGDALHDNSPTLTMGVTQAGAILGTAAYMSPEQAKGKIADRRADIWSFGIVVYEMLAGKKLFRGESVVEILGGVLNKDPDLSAAPPRVQKLLRWCLQKDRKHRLQAIGDARILLEESGAESPAQAASLPHKRSNLPWAVAAVLAAVLAVLAGWALWPRPVQLKPLVRLDLELTPPVTATVGSGPVLSPDSSRIVYVGNSRLYTRRLDQGETTEISGTEGATGPFFSPDGQTVGFYAQGRLKKVSLAGGGVVAISAEGVSFNIAGGSWGPDGNIFSAVGVGVAPIVRLPAAGGKAEPLGELYREQNEAIEALPQILPGGRLVLYTGRAVNGLADDAFTVGLSLPGMTRKVVQRNAAMARYIAPPDGSGYLLHVNRGTLFAVPFDVEKGLTVGNSTPMLEGVLENGTLAGAQFDVSANGTMVYQRGSFAGGSLTLQWLDSAGKLQPVLAKPGPYGRPTVSPDGTRVALDNAGDVWTYDWQREIMTRLTTTGCVGGMWSLDSRFVLYSGSGGIGWTRSDGGAAPQTLIKAQNLLYPWSFSPDGKRLAYFEITAGGYDIYTVTIENDGATLKAGTPEPLLKTPADERYPGFSPDGHWMMYASSESGTFQVYVRAFPDKKGDKWQVSSAGGTYPEWSRDGHTIFFRSLENQIMVANYSAKGDTFTPEKPRPWVEQRIAEVGLARNYSLHPDGKRVVALMPASASGDAKDATHVTILFNFFDELKRRVAAGK